MVSAKRKYPVGILSFFYMGSASIKAGLSFSQKKRNITVWKSEVAFTLIILTSVNKRGCFRTQ